MANNKNDFTTEQIQKMQSRIDELEKSTNDRDTVFQNFVDGFVIEQVNSSIKTIEIKTLQNWFSNPDEHMEQISNLLNYYYITDGDIFQLYDLIFSLPKLDYRIKAYETPKSYDKDLLKIKQVLEKKIKFKRLTRDLLIQEAHEGTVIGTWLGNATNPYFYVFNDLDHIFPYGMYKGTMRAVFDLEFLGKLKEPERNALYENLKPLITKAKFEKWKNTTDTEKKKEAQYVLLPADKTLVARGHTLYRNQRLGIPYGTASLFDMNHKQKMKELERSIADKVIRAIAVLKFSGKNDNGDKVPDSAKNVVFKSVKKALEKSTNSKNGTISVVAIPDFASFEQADLGKGVDNVLNPEKFENVNRDMSVSNGINDVLVGGNNGNYASAKLNLDIIYQKIGVMLEEIEEIYNQLIVMILGEKKGMNYTFEFIKDAPLSRKERVDTLMKFEAQGHNLKYILDELGIDFQSYYNQSVYELNELKIRDTIKPPLSTYTATSDDNGRPNETNPTNENTQISKEIDGNSNPDASI